MPGRSLRSASRASRRVRQTAGPSPGANIAPRRANVVLRISSFGRAAQETEEAQSGPSDTLRWAAEEVARKRVAQERACRSSRASPPSRLGCHVRRAAITGQPSPCVEGPSETSGPDETTDQSRVRSSRWGQPERPGAHPQSHQISPCGMPPSLWSPRQIAVPSPGTNVPART
jgi:hypothetical protein